MDVETEREKWMGGRTYHLLLGSLSYGGYNLLEQPRGKVVRTQNQVHKPTYMPENRKLKYVYILRKSYQCANHQHDSVSWL
jgi:hypothetical protein